MFDKYCHKGEIEIHCGYMSALSGVYLDITGSHRYRLPPVNHNATNDHTTIAEIILNYSGSLVQRRQEQTHMPDRRTDFKTFVYHNSSSEGTSRFELRPWVRNTDTIKYGFACPMNATSRWFDETLDSWRDLLRRNPLLPDTQKDIAEKLGVGEQWKLIFSGFKYKDEYKDHRTNNGTGEVYHSWKFVEFMKMIGPLFPFRSGQIEGKHGTCAIMCATFGLFIDETNGVISENNVLTYEYFRKKKLIHQYDEDWDFRADLDAALLGEIDIDIFKRPCRMEYRYVKGDETFDNYVIESVHDACRSWSYNIAWNKLNSNKPYWLDLIAQVLLQDISDGLVEHNATNRPNFDHSLDWQPMKFKSTANINGLVKDKKMKIDLNKEVQSIGGPKFLEEGSASHAIILKYCGNPDDVDRERDLVNLLSANNYAGDKDFRLKVPFINSLRSVLIDAYIVGGDNRKMTTSMANKLWVVPKLMLYAVSEVENKKFEELYDSDELRDLSFIAILYFLNASHSETYYCELHGGLKIWHGKYFGHKDKRVSFGNNRHLMIYSVCLIASLIDCALDNPNEYIWKDGTNAEQIDTREISNENGSVTLSKIRSNLLELQNAFVIMGRELPNHVDALRNLSEYNIDSCR